jgi:hypothetical protein
VKIDPIVVSVVCEQENEDQKRLTELMEWLKTAPDWVIDQLANPTADPDTTPCKMCGFRLPGSWRQRAGNGADICAECKAGYMRACFKQ